MRLFRRREAKTAAPVTAISDLRAAQWSGMGQLVREGFERNVVAYRCVRMIAETAGSVGLRAAIAGQHGHGGTVHGWDLGVESLAI